jgi:TrmH family RNA methyltransferase
VQQVRALHQARGRREQQLLLLEGTHLLQECRRLQLQPQRLIATERWLAMHPQLQGPDVVQPVSPEVLTAMATTDTPDGVITLLDHPQPSLEPPRWPRASAPLLLGLDRIQDPGNLGTMLRSALAAGVDQVWLGGGADPWQPKVLRASAGAALELPVQRLEHLDAPVSLAQDRAASVVAAVREGGMPYWLHDWQQPTLLLLGNEGAGLSSDLLTRPLVQVTIPHLSAVESLNVAVAAGVLLLERCRQQATAAPDKRESSAAELGR